MGALRPQFLLLDLQRAQIERLRPRILFSVAVDVSKIAERFGDIPVFRSQPFLPDGQSASMLRFRVRIVALRQDRGRPAPKSFSESRSRAQITGALHRTCPRHAV